VRNNTTTIVTLTPPWFENLPQKQRTEIHEIFSYFHEPSYDLRDLLLLQKNLTNGKITQLFNWKFKPKPKVPKPKQKSPERVEKNNTILTPTNQKLFPPPEIITKIAEIKPFQQIDKKHPEIITKITERKPIQQKGKKRKQQAKTRSIYQESKRPKQTIRKTNETELPERLGHIQIKHDKNQFKQAMTTIGNNIDNVSSKNAKLGGNLEKVMRGIGVTILPTIGNHVSLQQNHTPTHKTKKVTHQKSVQYKNKHQLPKKLQKHGG
jgi:hypothetical protein